MPVSPDSVNRDAGKRQARPLVTIAIPTYNRAQFLRAAIDSALAQSYEPIEVVVSDNASTDETSEIVSSYQDQRLRYVRQESNIGLIGNWNACLELVQGKYFLMLSDDDRLAPHAIRDLVKGFKKSSEAVTDVGFVYGLCEIDNKLLNETNLSLSAPLQESSAEFRIEYLNGNRIAYPSATLFRTKDALEVGGYGFRYEVGTDVGMAFEISALYQNIVCTGNTTTYYQFHSESFTNSIKAESLVDTIEILSQMATSLVDKEDKDLYKETIKAGEYAKARFLVNNSVRNFELNALSLCQVLKRFWQFRRLFKSKTCLLVLFKGIRNIVIYKLANSFVVLRKA